MSGKDFAKKYGTVAAWFGIASTLVLSLITLFVFSIPTDERARVAEKRAIAAETRSVAADERSSALFEPIITLLYHVAYSHDLSAQADREWRSRQGLNVVGIVLTTYCKQLTSQPLDSPNPRYLFIIFANRSSGVAKSVTIESLKWLPKPNQTVPTGVDDIPPQLDALGLGQATAILVDVAEGIRDEFPLENSHAEDICVRFTYTNLVDTPSRSPMKNPMWRAVPPRQGTKRSAIGDRAGSSRVPLDTGLSRLDRSSHSGYRIWVHPIASKTLRIQFMSP